MILACPWHLGWLFVSGVYHFIHLLSIYMYFLLTSTYPPLGSPLGTASQNMISTFSFPTTLPPPCTATSLTLRASVRIDAMPAPHLSKALLRGIEL